MRVPAGRAAAKCAIATATLGHPHVARADIHESVDRLADAWRGVGAAVVIDKTRFLTDDSDDQRPVVVALPELPAGDCTTVVLLGARGLGFHVRVLDNGSDDVQQKRLPSVAGALSIERCGDSPPRRLVLASDSGRGAIETIIARSAKPLPSMRTVLPERSGGVLTPNLEPGVLPPLPPPERRAETAEARAKRDGAAIASRETWQSGMDGTGAGEKILDPGCHTLQLFAFDPRALHPSRHAKLDLDAEMRDEVGEHVLARDRSDAPDAQLSACVGETAHVDVVFAGAPPSSTVLVSQFTWRLPEHLPALWGSDAVGRIAHVLWARHVVSLPREPVVLAQGVSGVTPVPLSIEPGACYIGVTARIKESARAIGLRIHVGSDDALDDRGIEGDGAAVAFCAGSHTHALAEVEARGTPLLGWGFALYRVHSGVWETPP